MSATIRELAAWIEERMLERNRVSQSFFPREAERLASICRSMADRFLAGGRLLAFGRGPYATDAQHVSVEFVHPIMVGKRALPALALPAEAESWISVETEPHDMVMGFGPPQADPAVEDLLSRLRRQGALTFALPGTEADYAVPAPSADPFIHQEMLEVLYHALWESVHVFLEHQEIGSGAGAAAFLYPFLADRRQDHSEIVVEVADSILAKAVEDEALRTQVAGQSSGPMAAAALEIRSRIARGGRILVFGNGGSATDANDFAIDCTLPPPGYRPVRAISLAREPAILTAIANDVGTEVIFLRQLIAYARGPDVAMAISTSGSSANIVSALLEARKRGLLTVALLGCNGGTIAHRRAADFTFIVPCDYIPRIQEVQASIYHLLREALERV